MPFRVRTIEGDNASDDTSVFKALALAEQAGCRVSNYSASELTNTLTMTAYPETHSHGMVSFAATGNSPDDIPNYNFPAQFPSVYGVGMTDESGSRIPFIQVGSSTGGSSWFNGMAFVAPGKNIFQTWMYPNDVFDLNVPAPGYAKETGTSNASPIAAGTAALILSVNPSLSSNEVWMIMRSTARQSPFQANVGPGSAYDQKNGWGLINAGTAVEKASNYWAAGMAIDPGNGWIYYLWSGRETLTGHPACPQTMIVRDKRDGSPTIQFHTGYENGRVNGNYPGFYPRAIGVGGDHCPRTLDTNDNGSFRLVRRDPNSGAYQNTFTYTPGSGWHATDKIAVRASDSHTFLLLRHSSGPSAILEFSATLGLLSTSVIPNMSGTGPTPTGLTQNNVDINLPTGALSWMPEDLTIDANGRPALLWCSLATGDFQYVSYGYTSPSAQYPTPILVPYFSIPNFGSPVVYSADPVGNTYQPTNTSSHPFGSWQRDLFVPMALRFAPDGSAYVLCDSAPGRTEIWNISSGLNTTVQKWAYAEVQIPGNTGPISPVPQSGISHPRFAQSAKAFAIGGDGLPRLLFNGDDRKAVVWKIVKPNLPQMPLSQLSAPLAASPTPFVTYNGLPAD